MKIFTKRIVVFSILHFTVLLASIMVSFSLGMSRFDAHEMKESLLESIARISSDILGFPGMYLWTPWASKNLPNLVEWLVVIGNSVLWGVVLAYFYTKVKQYITSGSI